MQELTQLGWNVLVVWECELKKDMFNETMEKLIENIRRGTVTVN